MYHIKQLFYHYIYLQGFQEAYKKDLYCAIFVPLSLYLHIFLCVKNSLCILITLISGFIIPHINVILQTYKRYYFQMYMCFLLSHIHLKQYAFFPHHVQDTKLIFPPNPAYSRI